MDTTPVLLPYKSVGVYLDPIPPFIFQINKKEYLLVSTLHSFKLMRLPSLKIKLMGPHFPNKIRAICAVNERIFIATKNKIHRLHYYHIEKTYMSGFDDKITCLLNFGGRLICGDRDGNLQIFDEKTGEKLLIHQFGWSILKLVHPNTYLNKILVAGNQNLILFNIMTGKLIFFSLYKLLFSSQSKESE
jgi:U3 small nucleolar RNA-associated protein 21